MKVLSIYIWSVALIMGMSVNSFAQGDSRPSEKEINTQRIFIEATKEKLTGNYEDAIYLFNEVLRKDKENDAASYELAKLHDMLNESNKAIRHIKNAIEFSPNNVWYSKFYSDLLRKAGKYEEAARVYGKLVDQNPEQKKLYFDWAYLLIKAQKVDEAIQVFDNLERQVGVNEETSKRKHSLYMSIGEQSKAAKELQKLSDEFPTDTRYLFDLATFYEQIDKDAKPTYKKILKLDPENAEATLAMNNVNKQGGDASYIQSMKEIFKNPEVNIDIKVKQLLPFIDDMAKNPEDEDLKNTATDLAEILVKAHPREAKAHSVAGDVLYYAGKKEAALAEYMETVELKEDVFAVWEQIMYINAEIKDTEALLKSSENAMDLFPNQPVAYYLNGVGNRLNKDYDEAEDILDQALMMSGKNKELKYQIQVELATVYNYAKEYKKSDAAFDAALKMNAKDYVVLNNYSYFLTERGEKLDKAEKMAAYANELMPNNPLYMDTHAWVMFKKKNYKGAKTLLKKALDNGGDASPLLLEHYGDILFKLKEETEAVIYWQKAVEKGGTSDKLNKKIADKKLYE